VATRVLPSPGAHFGNLAVVQDHAADQLHVEVPHAEGPFAGFAHDREGFRKERVQRLALGHAFLEFDRLAAQLFIGQRTDTFLERVDLADSPRILLDQPIIAAAENLFE
jgi:hypothetical protein